MADKKISALTQSTPQGSDSFVVARSGSNYRIPFSAIHTGPVTGAMINIVLDGGGSALTPATGCAMAVVPWPATILEGSLLCDVDGSIQVDIEKTTYADFPSSSSICGASPLSVSSGRKTKDTTLSGWTTQLSEGDILIFNVDSASTVTRCVVSLKVRIGS